MKSAVKRVKQVKKDEVDAYLARVNARSMFVGSSLNMGWRLAVMVVIPIVFGVKLDEYYKSEPSYTLTGIMIAAFGACVVVWGAVKEANASQKPVVDTTNKVNRKKNV